MMIDDKDVLWIQAKFLDDIDELWGQAIADLMNMGIDGEEASLTVVKWLEDEMKGRVQK